MASIRTLTVFTIAFERKKEELYGFRQTVIRGFTVLFIQETFAACWDQSGAIKIDNFGQRDIKQTQMDF